ncbi:hypothetical protein [Microbulbifer sp. SSSA005]|uniref:hypothetical protein n=1 Tax=unclassified Microbulbifer TaxID=2619833 RepID=UPI00403959CA
MFRSIFLFFCFLVFSCGASAASTMCSQYGNKLDGLVGPDSGTGDRVFSSLKSEGNECGCTFVRFIEGTADVNKVLSVLMAAKVSGNTVRVDFAEPDNCNSGVRVYLE